MYYPFKYIDVCSLSLAVLLTVFSSNSMC